MSDQDRWPSGPVPYPRIRNEEGFSLRPWRIEDASSLAAAWADENISSWLNPPVPSIDSARDWIAGVEHRWRNAQAFDLVVDVCGEVAGEIGFSSFDVRRRTMLVGYWIAAEHRGNGLAGRAAARACSWALEAFPARAVLSHCLVENVASRRTAVNAGFELLYQNLTASVFVLWNSSKEPTRR